MSWFTTPSSPQMASFTRLSWRRSVCKMTNARTTKFEFARAGVLRGLARDFIHPSYVTEGVTMAPHPAHKNPAPGVRTLLFAVLQIGGAMGFTGCGGGE